MRIYLIFLLILFSIQADSQPGNIDTFFLKKSEFISAYWTGTIIVDTFKSTKDSLIINFKNNKGYTRQEIKIKNHTGCVKYSYTNYINIYGLLAYSEHWTVNCQNTDPNDYDGILDTYRRFHYNGKGQLVSEFVYNSGTGTWRYDYLYSTNGNRHSKSLRLTRNEFWND